MDDFDKRQDDDKYENHIEQKFVSSEQVENSTCKNKVIK